VQISVSVCAKISEAAKNCNMSNSRRQDKCGLFISVGIVGKIKIIELSQVPRLDLDLQINCTDKTNKQP
jgi:hypothetical protein